MQIFKCFPDRKAYLIKYRKEHKEQRKAWKEKNNSSLGAYHYCPHKPNEEIKIPEIKEIDYMEMLA